MTTPEDLAKAEQIVRKHCGANIRATGPTVTDDDWEPGYAGLRDTIAQALAEARTTPKPAAEVVEALEALIERSEAQEQYAAMQRAGRPSDKVLSRMAKTENALQQARAALAAQSAREQS